MSKQAFMNTIVTIVTIVGLCLPTGDMATTYTGSPLGLSRYFRICKSAPANLHFFGTGYSESGLKKFCKVSVVSIGVSENLLPGYLQIFWYLLFSIGHKKI